MTTEITLSHIEPVQCSAAIVAYYTGRLRAGKPVPPIHICRAPRVARPFIWRINDGAHRPQAAKLLGQRTIWEALKHSRIPWFGIVHDGWSEIKYISVNDIAPLPTRDRQRLEMYVALLRAHEPVKPVSLIRCGAQFQNEDGVHRLAAHKLVGRTMIAARIKEAPH